MKRLFFIAALLVYGFCVTTEPIPGLNAPGYNSVCAASDAAFGTMSPLNQTNINSKVYIPCTVGGISMLLATGLLLPILHAKWRAECKKDFPIWQKVRIRIRNAATGTFLALPLSAAVGAAVGLLVTIAVSKYIDRTNTFLRICNGEKMPDYRCCSDQY